MKLLLITKLKDMFNTLPTEQKLMIVKGTIAFVEKYRDLGKIEAMYSMPGLDMSATVWKCDSEDELDQLFFECPFTPFLDNEIYVVNDFIDNMKRVQGAVEQIL